jgi:predicted transglutaminase-like cysteine proteinase
MPMRNTVQAQVSVDEMPSVIVRRAAPYILAAALAIGVLAAASGAAVAKSRKPHPVDFTGFGAVPRIELPQLHDPAPLRVVAPARIFTNNKVLAKLDGHPQGDTRLAERTDAGTLSDAARSAAPPQGTEPFGLFTFRAPEGELWQKWRGVSFDIARDIGTMAQCRAASEACSPAAKRFIAVIDAARALDGRARLDAVNRAVNGAVVYMTDMQQHGVADLWSSPLATFATLRGDCEDYAIAKFVALREAGVAADDLRIVLAHDNALGEDHAVLAARLDAHWLILDNMRAEVVGDGDEKHLAPLFAIDHDGVKLFAAPYVERMMDGKDGAIAPAADGAPVGASGLSTRPVLL